MGAINHLGTLPRGWLSLPTVADDEEQARIAALLYTALLALLAIGGGSLVAAPLVGTPLPLGLSASFGVLLAYLGLLLLLRRGLVWLACGLFVGLHWLVITLAAISVDVERPTGYGDHTRLVEVAQNLIENAVKFRRPRSRLQITVGHDRREGDLHRLFGRDNGVGIAPQHQEQIFELFTRLDAQTEGTGIGLTLVRRIVDAHGGRVWVEAEGLNRGCTFWFTLRAPPEAG